MFLMFVGTQNTIPRNCPTGPPQLSTSMNPNRRTPLRRCSATFARGNDVFSFGPANTRDCKATITDRPNGHHFFNCFPCQTQINTTTHGSPPHSLVCAAKGRLGSSEARLLRPAAQRLTRCLQLLLQLLPRLARTRNHAAGL